MPKKLTVKPHAPKRTPKIKVLHIIGRDGKEYGLTLQEKLFCEKYCEYSADSIEAVISAGYAITKEDGTLNRPLASSIASENLRKPQIIEYVSKIMDQYGLNDTNVDRELLFLVNQDADLATKKGAIDIYYKKSGGYAPEKVEHSLSRKLEEALDVVAGLLPQSDK